MAWLKGGLATGDMKLEDGWVYTTKAGVYGTSYLQRAKQLASRLQATADWETYMQALRTRYPTLRALHDELHQAQL